MANSFGTAPNKKKHLVFVGNPGSGKSTLLNCIMNSRSGGKLSPADMFESGVSVGSGMTYQLDFKTVGDVIYMDTPGLEDTKKRKQAAEAITKALKQDGNYQTVFVVTLEAGRVKPADVTTIRMVLESAKEINCYGVIFNKVGKKVMKKLADQKWELLSQVSLADSEDKPTPVPFFIEKYAALDDEDNAIMEIPEIEYFLNTLPTLRVSKSKVDDIPTESYEALNSKLESKLADLKADNEKMRLQKEEDKKNFQKKYAEMQKEKEEAQRQKEEAHAREMKMMEKSMTVMQENNKAQAALAQKSLEQIKEENKVKMANDKMKHEENMERIKSEERKHTKELEQKQRQHDKEMEIASRGWLRKFLGV